MPAVKQKVAKFVGERYARSWASCDLLVYPLQDAGARLIEENSGSVSLAPNCKAIESGRLGKRMSDIHAKLGGNIENQNGLA